MPEFLKSLTIREYRGFYTAQKINFANPNGNLGSGLTILVGQNNSGKSTVLEAIRKFKKDIQFERADRHPGADVEITIENSSGNKKTLKTSGAAMTTIDHVNLEPVRERFYPISSRRYWESYFSTHSINRDSYRGTLFDLERNGKDGGFGQKMIEIEKEQTLKKRFNELMIRLFPQFSDWYIELDRGSNYIVYKTKGGASHTSEFFGDGSLACLRFALALLK